MKHSDDCLKMFRVCARTGYYLLLLFVSLFFLYLILTWHIFSACVCVLDKSNKAHKNLVDFFGE